MRQKHNETTISDFSYDKIATKRHARIELIINLLRSYVPANRQQKELVVQTNDRRKPEKERCHLSHRVATEFL